MASPAAASLILRAIVSASVLPLLLPSAAAVRFEAAFTSQSEIDAAIYQANENAQVCNRSIDCLGEPTTVILRQDVLLNSSLAPLKENAHVIIIGGCPRPYGRCIIDGNLQFKVFSGNFYGPDSVLELHNLIVQRANGGVINSMYSRITGKRLIFRNNINGVIIQQGSFGGYPPLTFEDCRWVDNNGTAIWAGNGKYGLGAGFTIKRSIFVRNSGYPEVGNGGAVSLSGFGKSTFQDVVFYNNYAQQTGGAVFLDETEASFIRTTFVKNIAEVGGGAVSGISGYYHNLTAAFCSSSFEGNIAPRNESANSLLFISYFPQNPVTLPFCNTEVPPGSIFSEEGGSFITGNTTTCGSYCTEATPV